jgi:hypothetical protein
MISESKFFEQMCSDIEAEKAAAAAASGEAPEKDTYTRAEVDALIMDKIKEFKEDFGNVNTEEGNTGSEAGAEAGTEAGGEENE